MKASLPSLAGRTEGSFHGLVDFYASTTGRGFSYESRELGMFGVQLVAARQPSFDHAVRLEALVVTHMRSPSQYAEFDIGDGAFGRAPLVPGTMTVFPPAETRTALTGDHEVLSIGFPQDRLADVLSQSGVVNASFGWGRLLASPEAVRLSEAMWRAGVHAGSSASLYVDGLALQLLALLSGLDGLAPSASGRPEDARIARAIDYIEAHLGEALTVATLAGVACFSPGHFSRAFKATTGDTVWGYVKRRRGERALEMLQQTDLSLAEVAYRCGFAHQAHFTSSFKGQFGVTPGALRRPKCTARAPGSHAPTAAQSLPSPKQNRATPPASGPLT